MAAVLALLCLFGTLSAVQATDITRMTFEKIHVEEGENDFSQGLQQPFLEMLSSAALGDSGVDRGNVSKISWNMCGKPSKVKLQSLSLTPDPVRLPGNVQVKVKGSLATSVSAPVPVSIEVERKFGVWVKVQTFNINDVCSYAQGVCPLKQGPYSVNKSMKASMKVPSGSYRVTANFSNKGAALACIQVTFSVK